MLPESLLWDCGFWYQEGAFNRCMFNRSCGQRWGECSLSSWGDFSRFQPWRPCGATGMADPLVQPVRALFSL